MQEGIGWRNAVELLTGSEAYGLVEKGKTGRLAIRFKTEEKLAAFAQQKGIPYQAGLMRWKVTGFPMSLGSVGLIEALTAFQWDVLEITYMDERQATCVARVEGAVHSSHVMIEGLPNTIKYKALNAAARKAAAE